MTDQDWTAILDRLERIRTLADRAGTQEEAEAAAAAMTRLLTRYNLSSAELDERLGRRTQDDWNQATIGIGARARWRIWLVQQIARQSFCRALTYSRSPRMILIGEPKNLEVAKELAQRLLSEVDRLADQGWAAEHSRRPWAGDRARTWKEAYRWGAAQGIDEAMRAARTSVVEEVPGGSVLILAKDAEADAAVARFYPEAGPPRQRSITLDAEAYSRGLKDGRKVRILERQSVGATAGSNAKRRQE